VVRQYNGYPPFNFSHVNMGFFGTQFDIHISIYAAHLYDSVRGKKARFVINYLLSHEIGHFVR